MSNSITDQIEVTVPAAGDFLISETTGKIAHKSSYSNIKADMLANIAVTNNARLFDCSYRLNGDYSPADMIAGATTLTGTGGRALLAGQIVLRYNDTNKKYNGLWQIQTTGAAIRYSKANTGGLLMYSLAMPNAGDYKGRWYKCTNYAAVIGTDPVEYSEKFTPGQSLETTDSPTFAGATISGHNIDSELDTLNGRVNQGVKTTDSPTFASLTVSGAVINESGVADVIRICKAGYALYIDEDKHLSDKQDKVANVSSTKIGYLDGVTSSLARAYASIFVSDGTVAQTIPTGAAYTKVTAYTTNGLSANCTADAVNDKITITAAGVYRVSYTASYTSGTNNVTFRAAVFVGGVEQSNIHSGGQMGLIGALRSTAAFGFVNVETVPADIDLRIRHDNGGSVDITHVYANLNVEKIG